MLIATGVQWRKLEVPGIDRMQGAGVYYGGGSQEAISCKGEIVYVIGGANSAGQAALNFAQYAEKVVMLVRGDSLSATMSRYLIDQIEKTPNIQVWTHAAIIEVHGETHLEEISVQCSDTNTVERVPASSLFIYIGALPRTDWLEGTVARDERGFVLAGPDLLKDGKLPACLEAGPRSLSAGEQRAGGVCRGRCPARFHQAGGLGGRRGSNCGAVYPSLYGEGVAHVERHPRRASHRGSLPRSS